MTMRKLTRAEAKRFAHKLTGDLIGAYRNGHPALLDTTDGPILDAALLALQEQHYRYGPKRADRAPIGAVPRETPLLDVLAE